LSPRQIFSFRNWNNVLSSVTRLGEFAQWVIVYFEQFSEKYKSNIWLILSTVK
jgi:hypothetical protein